nr:MAG TPA: stabilization protein [Caudoviricetes sp.]
MADMVVEGLPVTTVTVSTDNDYGAAKRSVVLFNVCEVTEGNIVSATFKPTILIFPDKKSFAATPTTGLSVTAADLGASYPDLTVATSFQGRVFGSDGGRVFASEYNDYAGWELDTADSTLSSHAWVTTTQTNVRANDDVTGVTVYQNHVVVFKRSYMHMIYGTENPFRLVDIGERGAVGARAFAEINGILYFASGDGIMAFDGDSVSCISRNVLVSGEEMSAGTVLCGDARYLYVNDGSLALRYDTVYGVWVRQALPSGVTVCDMSGTGDAVHAAYLLSGDGRVYVPALSAAHGRYWMCETDLMCLARMDVRRVKKVQIMGECDASGIPAGTESVIRVYLLRRGDVFSAGKSTLIAEKKFSPGRADEPFILRTLSRMFSSVGHRLYITGDGVFRIVGIDMRVSYGGDVYVTQ